MPVSPLSAIRPPEGLTGGEPQLRQCGRCRGWFDGDPDAHPTAQAEWWLCPPCRAILLGGPSGGRSRGA